MAEVKREMKSKEQLQHEMQMQAQRVKEEEFNNRLHAFLLEQKEELGLILEAQIHADRRGIFPVIGIVPAPKEEPKQVEAKETKQVKAKNETKKRK